MFIKHYLFEDIWRCIFLFFLYIQRSSVDKGFFFKAVSVKFGISEKVFFLKLQIFVFSLHGNYKILT